MLREVETQTFEVTPSPSGVGADVIGLDLSKPLDERTFKRLSDTQKEQAMKDRKEIVRRLANVLF